MRAVELAGRVCGVVLALAGVACGSESGSDSPKVNARVDQYLSRDEAVQTAVGEAISPAEAEAAFEAARTAALDHQHGQHNPTASLEDLLKQIAASDGRDRQHLIINYMMLADALPKAERDAAAERLANLWGKGEEP